MDITKEIPAIKELRNDIDNMLKRIEKADYYRETSICVVKLQEADMWLGMYLERLKQISLNPNAIDPYTGTKIEPTTDGLKV